MNLSEKVMRGDIQKLCLLILLALDGGVWAVSICERGKSWWNRQLEKCVPCTKCEPEFRLAIRFPCQPHRDAICHSLQQVRIWPFNKPSQSQQPKNETSDTSDNTSYQYDDTDVDIVVEDVTETKNNSDMNWGIQITTMTLAASGCVMFFVVVLTLSIYHAKQWKLLRHALHSDVQNFSAKLKLMEAGMDSQTEPIVAANHHIYCNVHVGKESLLGTATTKKGFENVYTEEKHSS